MKNGIAKSNGITIANRDAKSGSSRNYFYQISLVAKLSVI